MSIAIANQLFLAYLGRPADVQWQSSTAGVLNGGQPSVALQQSFYNAAVSEGRFSSADSPSELVNKIFQNMFGFGASSFEQQAWGNLISNGSIPPAQAAWTIFTSYLGATNVPAIYQQPVQSKLIAMQAFTTELAANPAENVAYSSGAPASDVGRTYVAGVTSQASAAAAIASVGPTVDSILTVSKFDLTASAPSVTEGNAGTSLLTFVLTLDRAPTEPVLVNFETLGTGTATAGSDFVSGAGTVTFARGQTSTTVTVTVNGDTVFEPNETINVRFTGASLKNTITATGTINNDDVDPATFVRTLSVNAPTVVEGNAGTSNLVFTLTLNQPAAVDTTINFTTLDTGTATAGADFNTVSGSVTILAGQSSALVTVPVIGELVFEAAETVNLKFSGALLAATVTATGTINNDDLDPLTTDQTFSLTEGADQITGLAGGMLGSKGLFTNGANDTIIAGPVNISGIVAHTLGAGDLIDGGAGVDRLNLLDGAGLPFTPTMTGVEKIFAQSTGGTTSLNMVNVTGSQSVTLTDSTSGLNIQTLKADQAFAVVNSNGVELDVQTFGGAITDGAFDLAITSSQTNAGVTTTGAEAINSINLSVGGGAKNSFGLSVADALLVNVPTLNVAADVTNPGAGTFTLSSAMDNLTTVAVTFANATDFDKLATNNSGVTFTGGAGSTVVSTGKGGDVITTQGGSDVINAGDGNNTVNSGGGNDQIAVGIGNDTVNAGADNDAVDITAGGDDTVDLGSGDDVLFFDGTLTKNDVLTGGEGIDTLNGDLTNFAAATVTGDVDAKVNGFERIVANGNVGVGVTETVNLDNLDDISHVTLTGITDAQTVAQETQTFKVLTGTDTTGGIMKLGNTNIDLAANLTVDQVGAAIVAAGVTLNQVNEGIKSIVYDAGTDVVTVVYNLLEGDTSIINVTGDAGVSAKSDALFGMAAKVTDGVNRVQEVQTAKITAAVDPDGGQFTFGGVNFTFLGNEGIDVVGAAIVAKQADIIAASAGTIASVAYTALTDLLTLTYTKDAGDVAKIVFTDNPGDKTTVAMTITDDVTKGDSGTSEIQTVKITQGTDANGGVIKVNGVSINVAGSLTVDELGISIVSQQLALIAGDAKIQDVNYNTANDTLTFTYTKAAGALADNYTTVTDDAGTLITGATFGAVTANPEGIDGDVAGTVVLDNMLNGGTVVLAGDNQGTIDVNLKANTAADTLNVTLANNINHNGALDVTGFETLAIVTESDGGGDNQQNLGLVAPNVTSVTVTGNANVNFINAFAALTSFNGSATGAGAGTNGHIVVTNAATSVTLTGGADNDQLIGGTAGDVLIGNGGIDTLVGRDGADTLTGGAGNDVFFWNTFAESFGGLNDTITDFTAGTSAAPQDKLDFSAVVAESVLAFGFVGPDFAAYRGEVTSLAQANSALGLGGLVGFVLDTTAGQLYVDRDGNSVIDGFDMIINLTGVTDLSASNFIF